MSRLAAKMTEMQQFLDEGQYATNQILKYEKICGAGFVSTGGLEVTKEFVERLKLKENQKVLDLACGIGGGAFYMAKTFGATVLGIDLSTNMVNIAMERIAKETDLKNRIELKVMDVMTANFEANSFDVIHSRDTIFHIEKKEEFFRLCLKWLKPGGQFIIADHCCGTNIGNEDPYLKKWKYFYLDHASYGKLLVNTGFVDVDVQDRTEQFIQLLTSEMSKAEHDKDSYLKQFSEADYEELIGWWQEKVERCQNGLQKWGHFYARKPFL